MFLYTALIFLGSVGLTMSIIPKVIGVARYKELMDKPNKRSSHFSRVPRLGGVAFYISLMLSFYFLQRTDQNGLIHSIVPCLTILFIVGLKDDLVVLTAKSKIIAQIVAASFLIFDPDLSLQSLHGFLNVYHVPEFVSVLLLYLIITGIINAMNLMDGIDGLATIIGVITLSFLAICFYISGKNFSYLFMISAIGTLVGFLPFNMSKKNKIFMGDTGSLLIGFVIAYGCVRLLTMETSDLYKLGLPLSNIPFLLIFIFFIPVMDTLRVMSMRMLRGKGPFSPDRTHLHHYFLDKHGWGHLKTALFIGGLSIVIGVVGYILCDFLNYLVLFPMFVLFYLGTLYLSYQFRKKKISRTKNHLQRSRVMNEKLTVKAS